VNETKPSPGARDSESEITLGLLNAVHENSGHTQRSMARELGIALGLANAYLKRCVKKGLIKVSQVPPNRYAYYLTPQGFSEKSRLTAEYLASSFTFFRRARHQSAQVFAACADNGWRRLALAGTGDLGEVATLCARDYPITLVGFVDGAGSGGDAPRRFAGLPVVRELSEMGPVDAVVVTDLQNPQATFETLVGLLPAGRVLAPPLLHVSGLHVSGNRPEPPAGAGEAP
jgi:DNA-binding MarR family transcriptional regulator